MKLTNDSVVYDIDDAIQIRAFLNSGWREVIESPAILVPPVQVTELEPLMGSENQEITASEQDDGEYEVSSMSITQLKAFAAERDIDISSAKNSQQSILSAIRTALEHRR